VSNSLAAVLLRLLWSRLTRWPHWPGI